MPQKGLGAESIIAACPTLRQELQQIMAAEGCACPVHWLPARLHQDPAELHSYLQDWLNDLAGQPAIEQAVLCVSGCGGATRGLRPGRLRLILPKTRDCLDLLLAQTTAAAIQRPPRGIFLTESWQKYMQSSTLDYATLCRELGQAAAEAKMREIYRGFNHFYIIDTGAYAIEPVREYIQPLAELLAGTVEVIPGGCALLHKLVRGEFDGDFQMITAAGEV